MWSHPAFESYMSEARREDCMRSRFNGNTPEARLHSQELEREGILGQARRRHGLSGAGVAAVGRRLLRVASVFHREPSGSAQAGGETHAS